ncbi:unnamed protein product [Angiostrongylus costaricensis]|uniref:Nucleotid_trans domain-containing protein n=1 Tax=Angiostrongylus costaricensis TaxID=334426 RepID=A0A0R3PN30_ANGCS|nr:unnamed protein product [Angiostrongylus costaricensis]
MTLARRYSLPATGVLSFFSYLEHQIVDDVRRGNTTTVALVLFVGYEWSSHIRGLHRMDNMFKDRFFQASLLAKPCVMVAGSRTCIPLFGGLMLGVLLALLLFSSDDTPSLGNVMCPLRSVSQKRYVDVSEHWEVHLDNMPSPPPNQDATPKVVRARFAATELGIRERLMVGVLAESSLAVAMNASLGRHVPRIHVFADASRIDTDLAHLTNLSPYKPNGQKSHIFVLGLIFNMTFHENFDWFLLVRDSTYINPFELNRLINSVNWNQRVLIGQPAYDGSGRCMLDAGVILSNPAMQKLIQWVVVRIPSFLLKQVDKNGKPCNYFFRSGLLPHFV